MKLAIVGPKKVTYEVERLVEEGKKYFKKVEHFPIPHITVEANKEVRISYKNNNLLSYAILPRIPRSYRSYGFFLLKVLENKGKILPIKPFSVILSHNKFLTLVRLQEAGLPVPRTFLSLKRKVIEEHLDEVGYPVVLKLLYGSLGIGVMFADSKESAISIIDTLERFNQPIFVEEFVENPGEDIRCYVIGEEIISMKRIAGERERRANIGIGGKGKPYKLAEEEIDLVKKAAEKLGMKICSIDFIHSRNGPVIIEANVNAQFKGLESVTKENVARKIVEFVRKIQRS